MVKKDIYSFGGNKWFKNGQSFTADGNERSFQFLFMTVFVFMTVFATILDNAVRKKRGVWIIGTLNSMKHLLALIFAVGDYSNIMKVRCKGLRLKLNKAEERLLSVTYLES